MSQHFPHEARPASADATGDELSDDELEAVTGGTNAGAGQPAFAPPTILPPPSDLPPDA